MYSPSARPISPLTIFRQARPFGPGVPFLFLNALNVILIVLLVYLIARNFVKLVFERRRGTGCDAPDPIFIVGLPRAGSTLLEQILSSHSQVDGTLELPNILSLSQRLRRRARQGLTH